MRLDTLLSAAIDLPARGCSNELCGEPVLDVSSEIVVTGNETALVPGDPSSRFRNGAMLSICCTATGEPLMRTRPPVDDDAVCSIETLTMTRSSAPSSCAWTSRKTRRFGAAEPGTDGGDCPANVIQVVDGESSPLCVFAEICTSHPSIDERPNSSCRFVPSLTSSVLTTL